MTVQIISCWDSFQCRCVGQLSVTIANVQDKQFIRMKDLFCLTVSEISVYGWLVLLQFLLSRSRNIWPENMREEIAQILRVGVKREGGTVFLLTELSKWSNFSLFTRPLVPNHRLVTKAFSKWAWGIFQIWAMAISIPSRLSVTSSVSYNDICLAFLFSEFCGLC